MILLSADTSVSDLQNPRYWLTDWASGQATASGERVTATTSMALSAYYACIRVIAEDVAKLPLKVFRELKPRGKEVVKDHPAYRLLHTEPNPDMTAMTFRQTLTAHALGWGSGYAEIQRTQGGDPMAFWPIHPSRATVLVPKTQGGTVMYQVKNDDGTVSLIPKESMLHIPGLGPDGYHGYSVAAIGAESLGLALAAQRYGATFFANGASLSGVLEHPGELKAEAKDYLRTSWAQMYSGASNTGKTAVLEEGMKFSKISIPPEEAQFIESRQFAVEEVCRWFRVGPHKIQHLLRATFNNIEMMAIEHVGDTLMPWLIRWEQEADRKLLRDDELYSKHVVQALLRGDSVARTSSYASRFNSGSLSQNDIRELEDENPIGPDGDVYYVPSNLTRSEDAAQGKVASSSNPPPAFEEPRPDEEEDDAPDGEEDPPADPPEPPAEEEDPQAAALAALRPVLVDACSRFVRRDAKAFSGSVRKRETDRVAWVMWRDEWTLAQAETGADWALPWALAVAGVSGREANDVGVKAVLGPPLGKHIEESAKLGGEHSSAAIETWSETRVIPLVEAFEGAVQHVLMRK